jgi:thiol-disulfide isomerase/thioredoxin
MPELQMLDYRGGVASVGALKGKPVVYNFWATWCGPCKAEMPDLNRIQRDYASKGLVVVGINVLENKGLIDTFLRFTPLDFTIWYEDKSNSFPHDSLRPVLATWQGRDSGYAIPYTVFVKASGEIAAVQLGYEASGRILVANVEKTLK